MSSEHITFTKHAKGYNERSMDSLHGMCNFVEMHCSEQL